MTSRDEGDTVLRDGERLLRLLESNELHRECRKRNYHAVEVYRFVGSDGIVRSKTLIALR